MWWMNFCKRFKFKTKLILFLSTATVLISGITGLITYRIHIDLFNEEVSRQYSLTAEQILARLIPGYTTCIKSPIISH